MQATATEQPAAPTKKGKAVKKPAGPAFADTYKAFAYRVLGKTLDRRAASEDEPDPLVDRLYQAGTRTSPGVWRAMMILTTILTVVVVGAFSIILFALIIQPSTWYLFAGGVTAVAALMVPATYSFLISSRISNRSVQMERELPFTLSELSVLASTGMTPIDLVHRMAMRDRDPGMTSEFKQVVYRTDIQGKDLISALSETALESPAEAVREAFWGLANMIHQGGNLDDYLRQKSEDVLKIRREGQRAFIERLTTYVDMYISLILIGVLMICVGAFLLNALGQTAIGLDANGLLELLTFGLVPLSVVVTVILVMTAYARSE